jgi:hypothetical protein
MTPEEIKYYRTKAAELLDHRYEDFAWGSLTEFGSNDDTLEARIREKHDLPPRPLNTVPYERIIKAPPVGEVKSPPASDSGVFTEQVAEAKGILSQPNAYTCQSACIAMAIGRTDIMTIRAELEAIGEPGDPGVMGVLLRKEFGDRYIFDDNASMSEIREWLRDGEFLISHGWFTASGHVIALDGVTIDPSKLSYKISVKDPWSEFSFSAWAYNNPSATQYDGDYSAHGLYASIIAGQSVSDAISIYQRGELDSNRKGAWIHRILPSKK